MDVMDPTYLPVYEDTLLQHFLVQDTSSGDPRRHLDYYKKSIDRRRALKPGASPAEVKHARQMEKDERFWIAAALTALHGAPRVDGAVGLYSDLLDQAGVRPPGGFATWAAALAGELHLHFEASIPSPASYRAYLERHLDEQMPIPHLRELGRRSKRYEGATRVDAILLAPETNAAVIFEAKVLSDVSTTVEYDMTRNQLARIIDASLEQPGSKLADALRSRRPDLTSTVLLTPEALSPRSKLKGAGRSRLYAFLMDAYREPGNTLLGEHLPHRSTAELAGVRHRLGWATWEDCNRVLPGACRWLE